MQDGFSKDNLSSEIIEYTAERDEALLEKEGYDKDADIEYTSTSVFCSKGQAFLVKWDNAEEYMHCIK